MNRRYAPWLWAAAVFAVHASSPVRMQTDSVWNVPVALSLWHHGDVTLDEYTDELARLDHGVERVNGHAYNGFPLGPSLLALPFVALTDAVTSVPLLRETTAFSRWQTNSKAEAHLRIGFFDTFEVLLGSLCVALSAVLLFHVVRARAVHRFTPHLTVAIFAFASPAWSTASRSLWQHGPAMACLSVALWAWLHPFMSRARALVFGAALGAAFVCRPTAAIAIAGLSLGFALRHRRFVGWVVPGAAAVAVPWLAFNQSVWEQWLPPYYLPSRLEAGDSVFLEALVGNLFSAARGLFVFCPLAVVALASALVAVRRGDENRIVSVIAVSVVAVHWVVISRFPHWWGGHAFGPRLFTELTPFAMVLLAPWLDALFVQRAWGSARGWVTGVLVALTVFVHARGALVKATWRWNDLPVNVDEKPERLWDFRDLPFLR